MDVFFLAGLQEADWSSPFAVSLFNFLCCMDLGRRGGSTSWYLQGYFSLAFVVQLCVCVCVRADSLEAGRWGGAVSKFLRLNSQARARSFNRTLLSHCVIWLPPSRLLNYHLLTIGIGDTKVQNRANKQLPSTAATNQRIRCLEY